MRSTCPPASQQTGGGRRGGEKRRKVKGKSQLKNICLPVSQPTGGEQANPKKTRMMRLRGRNQWRNTNPAVLPQTDGGQHEHKTKTRLRTARRPLRRTSGGHDHHKTTRRIHLSATEYSTRRKRKPNPRSNTHS